MKLFTDFEDVTVREENPVDQSALEKILEVEKEIFVEEKKNNWYSSFPSSKAYSFLYTSVEKKLANITMTAKLLQEYINTRENHNKNKFDWKFVCLPGILKIFHNKYYKTYVEFQKISK